LNMTSFEIGGPLQWFRRSDIKRRDIAKLNILSLVFFCLVSGICAGDEEAPILRRGELKGEMILDGVLAESAWAQADIIEGLTMVVPTEGSVPSGQTRVRVLMDTKTILFGIECQDPNPEAMVSFSVARDASLRHEDHIKLVLCTFPGSGAGYIFSVNPNGARYDALITHRGEGENSNWDGLWESKTCKHDKGWSAEIRIPISTLSFKKGARFFRFNVERRIQRFMETSRWATPVRNFRVTHIHKGGRIVGLPEFDLGIGLSVRPSFVGGFVREDREDNGEWDAEISLDITQKLGSNLLSSFTVNTDFAETEVDSLRTNLTRFPLFFPEKRSFFLEGTDYFDFGLGVGRDALPFHSRRIGLVDGEEIPLKIGGKIHGQIGDTRIGALVVNTGNKSGFADESEMAVVRVRQQIFAESSVGLLATAGDPKGDLNSYTAGVDFTYQTSEFLGNKNFLVGVWGLTMDKEELRSDSTSAIGGKIDYPNDLWDMKFVYHRIGEDFNPSLGFVPRTGINKYTTGIEYMPYPEWELVRQMNFEFFTTLYTDLDGNWESCRIFTAPINWTLESGDSLEFNVVRESESLDEDFEISDGVVIPKDSYTWNRYRFQVGTASKRELSGEFSWWFGPFYSGYLNTYEAELEWNPVSLLTFALHGEKNVSRLEQGSFKEDVYAGKIKFNFSPDLTCSSLVQYETEGDYISTNTRVHWDVTPASTVHLIYNHNWDKFEGDWRRESLATRLKLQVTYRF